MNAKLDAAASEGKTAGTPEPAGNKLPYRRPTLTVFGLVRDLTGNGTGSGTDGGTTAGMTMVSDPRCKENIVRVGEHPAGFGLYLFDYKPEFRDDHGHGRRFGVMADEVVLIVPEAVSVAKGGYRAVNYAKLGVTCH